MFFSFLEKVRLDISHELSALQMIFMKCQHLFFLKKFRMLSATILLSVLRVKIFSDYEVTEASSDEEGGSKLEEDELGKRQKLDTQQDYIPPISFSAPTPGQWIIFTTIIMACHTAIIMNKSKCTYTHTLETRSLKSLTISETGNKFIVHVI